MSSKTETQTMIMENHFYRKVCEQIQDWKELIHEMEIKSDEVSVDDDFLERLENLKQNTRNRINHLNETTEPWQQEILKEYGIYKENRE